jgi:hypothetical protein
MYYLPSTFPRRETQSTPVTSYTVIHLRVSLAANTSASMLAKIYPGMTTYSRHQPKPAGFLRRNLRGCPQDVKVQVYTTLVRPVLEYASTVWDPYTLQQIYALERVQRQAARFVIYSMWTKVITFPPSSLYISYKTTYFHNFFFFPVWNELVYEC